MVLQACSLKMPALNFESCSWSLIVSQVQLEHMTFVLKFSLYYFLQNLFFVTSYFELF